MTVNLSDFTPLVALAIPVIAVTMAFIAIIVRMVFRQRARECVMRARIAAIERGVDPALLPKMQER